MVVNQVGSHLVMKKRTIQQNKALHVFFTLVAEGLNDAGLDMKKVLKPSVDIPWSKETVKDYLWKPIQKIQLKKEHTSELTTKEIDLIYDTLTRHLGEKFGFYEPFPSIEEIINKIENESNTKKY